jgi:hypothetical protein
MKESNDQLQEFMEFLLTSTDLCDHRVLRVWLAMGKLADSSVIEETLSNQQTRLAVDILFSKDEEEVEKGSPEEEARAAKLIQRLWRMRKIHLAKYSLSTVRAARLKMEQDVVATIEVGVHRAVHMAGADQCFFRVRLSGSPFNWRSRLASRQAPFGAPQSLMHDSHRPRAKGLLQAMQGSVIGGISMLEHGVGGALGGALHGLQAVGSGARGVAHTVGSAVSGVADDTAEQKQQKQGTEAKNVSVLETQQQQQKRRKDTKAQRSEPGMRQWHFDFGGECLPAVSEGAKEHGVSDKRRHGPEAEHGALMSVVDVTSDLIIEAIGLENNHLTGVVSEKLLGYVVVPVSRLLHGEHGTRTAEHSAAESVGASTGGPTGRFRLKRLFRLFPPEARKLNKAAKGDAREAMAALSTSHATGYSFDEGVPEPDWCVVGGVELDISLTTVSPSAAVANSLARMPAVATSAAPALATMYFSRPAQRALAIAAAADAAAAAKLAEEQERKKKQSNSSMELINVITSVVSTVTVLLASWDRLYQTLALPRCVSTFFCTLQCIPTPGLSNTAVHADTPEDAPPTSFAYQPSEYSVPLILWIKCAALYLLIVACICFSSWHSLPLLYIALLGAITWSVVRLEYRHSSSNILAHAWEEEEELEEWTLMETLEWIDELLDGLAVTIDSMASCIEKFQLMFSWVDPSVTALAFAVLAVAASTSSALLLVLQTALHLIWARLGLGLFSLVCFGYFISCSITAFYYFRNRDSVSREGSGTTSTSDSGIGGPTDLSEVAAIVWFDFWPGGREKLLQKHKRIFRSLGLMHHPAGAAGAAGAAISGGGKGGRAGGQRKEAIRGSRGVASATRRAGESNGMKHVENVPCSMKRWEGYTHSLKRLQFDVETNLKHKPASSNSFTIVAVYNNSSKPQHLCCTLDVAASRVRALANAGVASSVGSFHSAHLHGIGDRLLHAGTAAGNSVLHSVNKVRGVGLLLGKTLAEAGGIKEKQCKPTLLLLHQSGATSGARDAATFGAGASGAAGNERGDGELEDELQVLLQPYTSALFVAYGGPKKGTISSALHSAEGVHLGMSACALVDDRNTMLAVDPTAGLHSSPTPAHRRGSNTHVRRLSAGGQTGSDRPAARPLWAASFAAGGAQLVSHQHPPLLPAASQAAPSRVGAEQQQQQCYHTASSSVGMDQLPKLPGYNKSAVYRLWINEEERVQGTHTAAARKNFETKDSSSASADAMATGAPYALAKRLLAGLRANGHLREYTWRSDDLGAAGTQTDDCETLEGRRADASVDDLAQNAGDGASGGDDGGASGAVSTGQRDCFEGGKAVEWLREHEREMCQEQCRVLDSVYEADEKLQVKGALRLGNMLRTAGFLRRVQPVLPEGRHNQVGELLDHPCCSSSASVPASAARFEASPSLYRLDLAHGSGASKSAKSRDEHGFGSPLSLGEILSPASLGSRLGAFVSRLPDRKQMRHNAICALAETKVREDEAQAV